MKALTKKRKKKSDKDGSVGTETESTDCSEIWEPESKSSEDDPEYDPAQENFFEKVQMDADDMSTFGRKSDTKWEDYYQQAELHHRLRAKCLGQFYRFQRHIVGGDIHVTQALNNTRDVHIILHELDPHGTGLDCLVRDKSFDIWDKWASPRLRETLKGTTIRLYFRSLAGELSQVGQRV